MPWSARSDFSRHSREGGNPRLPAGRHHKTPIFSENEQNFMNGEILFDGLCVRKIRMRLNVRLQKVFSEETRFVFGKAGGTWIPPAKAGRE